MSELRLGGFGLDCLTDGGEFIGIPLERLYALI
jgi:hypothetical protein